MHGQIQFNQPNQRFDPNNQKLNPQLSGEFKGLEKEAQDEVKSRTKFEELLKKSEDILLKITTVFPFTLFPTNIVISATKVDIIDQMFFFSEQIHSVIIKDITDVVVETSLFFSTLKIIDKDFTENSINVSFFWTKDALKARDIIQGLVLACKEGVDLVDIKKESLKSKAETLGKVRQVQINPVF